MHLFFVKQFGCYLAEAGWPVDAQPFSRALKDRRAHPGIFLKLGRNDDRDLIASGSDLHMERAHSDGDVRFAAWIYQVGIVKVMVMYAAVGEQRQGLVDAWHPKVGSNNIRVAEF